MKPTGSGLNFHCDRARITSRSNRRLLDLRISTCVTLPLGATCTQAITLPLIPWRMACGGKVGSMRYDALYSRRIGGCVGAGVGAACGMNGAGGGRSVVVVVIVCVGG